ncbi:hypothetical protein [Crossiella sp. CA198]|uniref:hypothetical protein n=1 Tax=Crossiella sp. CA198 TaxID=3455607 RepID=UPI003F8D8A4A
MMEEELRNLKLAELNLPPVSTVGAGRPAGPAREFPAEPTDEYKAADSSNSLWITVDKEGKVLRLEVSTSWHTRLPAGEFASTLLTTYMSASETAAVVESKARERNRAQTATADTEASDGVLGLDEWLSKIEARHANLDRQLREARAEDDGRSGQVLEIRSPHGYLTLQVRSGALVGLTVDAERISRARGGQLQQDLWDGFTAAGLTSPDSATGAPASRPRRRQDPVAGEEEEELWKGVPWE